MRQLDWADPPGWLAFSDEGAARNTGQPPAGVPSPAAPLQQGEDPWGSCGSQTGQQERPQAQKETPGKSPLPPLGRDPFAWQPADVADLQSLRYILAADCIYDNDLTEALMRTTVHLMRFAQRQQQEQQQQQKEQKEHQLLGARSPAAPHTAGPHSPLLLVALEKRIAFTLHDLDVRAPSYDFWRTLFVEVPGGRSRVGMGASAGATSGASTAHDLEPMEGAGATAQLAGGPKQQAPGVCEPGPRSTAPLPLAGRRLDVGSVPQGIAEYERGEYLELWELWLDE